MTHFSPSGKHTTQRYLSTMSRKLVIFESLVLKRIITDVIRKNAFFRIALLSIFYVKSIAVQQLFISNKQAIVDIDIEKLQARYIT